MIYLQNVSLCVIIYLMEAQYQGSYLSIFYKAYIYTSNISGWTKSSSLWSISSANVRAWKQNSDM